MINKSRLPKDFVIVTKQQLIRAGKIGHLNGVDIIYAGKQRQRQAERARQPALTAAAQKSLNEILNQERRRLRARLRAKPPLEKRR